MHLRVWGLPFGQFYGGDAKGPDVGLGVVSALFDHLGSHPEGGSHKRVPLAGGVGKLTSNAEIG